MSNSEIRKHACGNCTLRDNDGSCKIQGGRKTPEQQSCSRIYTNFVNNGYICKTLDYLPLNFDGDDMRAIEDECKSQDDSLDYLRDCMEKEIEPVYWEDV
ncbi:hypothetical protein KKE60_06460 [Patescibacteria group bacterium]|nr:hypothetical protein [Patescibacteria group bacterium]